MVSASICLGLERLEVPAGERLVAVDAGIDHRAVEPGLDGDAALPVERLEGQADAGLVPVGHADQPLLVPARAAPGRVLEGEAAGQEATLGIERQVVAVDSDVVDAEPLAILDLEGQRQPVRYVDQVLVLDVPVADPAGQAVVEPGDVAARVVVAAGPAVGHRTTRDEVAVAECGQRFPVLFLLRHVAVIGENPSHIDLLLPLAYSSREPFSIAAS